jgi:hypothetical protein
MQHSPSSSQANRVWESTRKFITVFTRDRQWSLSWARWIHSTPSHHICFTSILIFSFYLRLCLPGVPFHCFLTKILYAFLISPMRATWPAQPTLDLITLIFCEAYKLWSSSLCSLLQSPATSSLLGPYVPLSTLFSNPSVCFLPFVWETRFRTHTNDR